MTIRNVLHSTVGRELGHSMPSNFNHYPGISRRAIQRNRRDLAGPRIRRFARRLMSRTNRMAAISEYARRPTGLHRGRLTRRIIRRRR